MNTRTLIASALALGFLAACSKPEPVVEAPRPVVVFTLASAQVAPAALYTGEVRARYESDLAFRIGGKIVERRVDVGAVVKPGQLLARLDPADAGLNAEAARAQLAAAENEFAYARAEVLRYRDLVAKNFVSRSVLDAKETAFRSATARVEQARAQASVAGRQAGYTSLLADQPGVITAVGAEVGQVVKDSAVVMKLARDGEREVLIAVPETRIGELKKAGVHSVMCFLHDTQEVFGLDFGVRVGDSVDLERGERSPSTCELNKLSEIRVFHEDIALVLGAEAREDRGVGFEKCSDAGHDDFQSLVCKGGVGAGR